ncbi:MAG: CGNR zinc finger domain-containing protein [Actinomycetota bacterium]
MTSQELYASDVGLAVALDLSNLARENDGVAELRLLFASEPISVGSIDDSQAEQLLDLAHRSADIAGLLAGPPDRDGNGAGDQDQDLDRAAELVNGLLERFPAVLHLTREPEGWTLHHHRRDAPLVPAWSGVVAGAFARVIGDGRQSRVGSCSAADCGRYFYDLSKNNSRRYCSLACQNRAKAAAYRSRQAG